MTLPQDVSPEARQGIKQIAAEIIELIEQRKRDGWPDYILDAAVILVVDQLATKHTGKMN